MSNEPAYPQRRRKAVRIYREAELAREFGQGLLNDLSFAQMVDAVQSLMQEDAETAAAMEKVGELLLSGSPPPLRPAPLSAAAPSPQPCRPA